MVAGTSTTPPTTTPPFESPPASRVVKPTPLGILNGLAQRYLAESAAFRRASLESEVRRAYAVMVVVLLIVLLVVTRASTIGLDRRLLVSGMVGMVTLLSLQLGVLVFVRRAQRCGCGIPTWFLIVTVVIEAIIPTGIMVANIWVGALSPYASLSSPPILACMLMISLTTLRLRPWLCVLGGALCAGGYAGVLVSVTYGMGIVQPTTGLPRAAYINSVLLIFIGGLLAAWVAREIRTHMVAALGEAETRRQMGRIEHDLAVARSIQRALLPRGAPAIEGYDIAGWNRPADQTGGDYYDWQRMPDGNWIVTLADVAGHGIGPALVTAACRAYMRASSAHHRDLGSLTSQVNRLLADDLPEGRFVTMVSVVVDPKGGALALLSAGHGPIVLYVGGTGNVEDILPQHIPLAIEPDMSFGPASAVALAPGDVLALVTDGFVEWARATGDGPREEFGMDRLRDSLRRHAHLSAAEMIRAITADVTSFAGGEPQQDDLTMVVIQRK